MKKELLKIIAGLCLLCSAAGCGSGNHVNLPVGENAVETELVSEPAPVEEEKPSEETGPEAGEADAGQPAVTVTEDEAVLLDISFFGTKEEAIKAAGSSVVDTIEVEETDRENPMSWCYMVYTARRDGVEVEYQRGYDTVTMGEPVGGFFPTTMESWNSLNEGESVVANVNVEWYPVFQLVATDSIYKGALPLGWDISLSRDENGGIPAPASLTALLINVPIPVYKTMEHLTDGFSSPDLTYGYYSDVEYFSTDEEHSALKKRLDALAKQDHDEFTEGLGMLGLEAGEAYEEEKPESYRLYHKDRDVALCRADEGVFSWVDYYTTDLGDIRSLSALGHNLDTKSGEDLSLADVITDKQALQDALKDRCERYGFNDTVAGAICGLTEESFASGDGLVSSAYYSWNICYEGLWIHFNDSLPQDVLSLIGGRNGILLSFREYPELVLKKFTNVPEAYCYTIEPGEKLNEYYALDVNRDGVYEEFAVREDKDGNSIAIDTDMSWTTYDEVPDGGDFDVLAVHTAADVDYLYVCRGDAEEEGSITVYNLTGEIYYEDEVKGNVIDMYLGGDREKDRSHIYMSDPRHFLMSRRDDRFGSNVSFAYHGTNRDGTPWCAEDYYLYAFDDDWKAYPLTDMTLDQVNEEGEVIGSGVLKEGTPVRSYRTDDWEALDLIDQEGNLWRLVTEPAQNGYGITIDGKSPDELFAGTNLRWG